MKKYLSVLIVAGLFVALPSYAETGNQQNMGLLERITGVLKSPFDYLQQPAAAALSKTPVSSVNVKARTTTEVKNTGAGTEPFSTVPLPKPTNSSVQDDLTNPPTLPSPLPNATPTSGCGQTLTPLGVKNETIRCDGTKWVRAKNLLNDGVNVGIGSDPGLYGIPLTVKAAPGFGTSIYGEVFDGSAVWGVASNGGTGVVGSVGGSFPGTGVHGQFLSANQPPGSEPSVGVVGAGSDGIGVWGRVNKGTGIRGSVSGGGTAVMADLSNAYVGADVYGFYQKGPDAKNHFQGIVSIGESPIIGPDSAQLTSDVPNRDAIRAQSIEGIGLTASSYSNIGVFGSSAQSVGVLGQTFGENVGNVAVKAQTAGSGHGFFQEGINAKNNLEGTLSVGYVGAGNLTPGVKIQANGGIKIATNQAAPACTTSTQGTFWFVKGAAGVKDTAQVCAKDAAGTFAWRVIY